MKFLRNTFTNEIFAVNDDDFAPTMVCDIFDRNGQRIDHADAGTSLTLLSDKAVGLANFMDTQLGGERWSVGDYLYAWDYDHIFGNILGSSDYVEGVDYELDCEMVEAMTLFYPDKVVCVVINSELVYSDWEWVDSKLSEALSEGWANRKRVGIVDGVETYVCNDYIFTFAINDSGTWWQYKVTERDER
jgi:hypothetical protein